MNTLVFTSQNNIGVMKMSKEKLNKQNKENKKTATDNQWTNNNLKYYPDDRKRQDGPGGN
ncbi:hypothetical protein HMPREF3037_01470 [Candidatus Stoquefichus sp. KLE1796]|nr:hypothetical protein HMPREF3037_01470 [Candidatus Stoquefichus sp. KLE1796]